MFTKSKFAVCLLMAMAVISKKPKKREGPDSEESMEDRSRKGISLDFRGTIRKSFALEVALSNHDGNLVCSPMSALLPLGKLALGAEGKVLTELHTAIGINRLSKLKKSFQGLIKQLRYLPGVTLDIASRLYVSKDIQLRSRFVEETQRIFGSGVERISFVQPNQAADDINQWVERHTNGMIPTILSSSDISSSTSLILVNAIYFAGKWKYPFESVKTDTFYSLKGSRKVPIMTINNGYFNYYQAKRLKAQIIELPYSAEDASLIVVLPNAVDGLSILLREIKLAPELLNSALQKLSKTRITVRLPKFKLETELDLKILYDKLGLKTIFRKPGLARIAKDAQLIISKAIQKAIIIVNEVGTEAAAASANQLVFVSAYHNPVSFNATHPFLFFVRAGNHQLFAGTFNEP